MIKYLDKYKFDKYFTQLTLFFLLSINLIYFFLHLTSNIDVNNYSFNELFINYQAGFIRRGLLGEIFWQINSVFNINPINFFSIFFLLIYLLQLLLFYYLLNKYIISKYIFILIFFAPSLVLFHIYDPNLYYIKDGIIKCIIILHAFIFYYFINIKKDNNGYIKYLKFLIIPLIFFSILTHEYQVFSISVHFLISLGSIKKNKNIKDLINIYLTLFIPFLLVIFFFGNQLQFENLNEILQKFGVTLNNHLGGGFIKYLGAFYKWHFFYFTYRDFLYLLLSFLLGVFIFYLLFQFLIKKKVLTLKTNYQKSYFIYFIPCLIPFFFTIDHGRNLSLIAFYLIAFYSTLNFNKKKLSLLNDQFNKNLINKFLLILFIFFFVLMWKLDQFAGFGFKGQTNTMFKSSLFAEFVKLIKYLYSFVDLHIISLPEIRL